MESVLSGLADNTVIVLPKTCCDAAGLVPNINDKQQPKNLVRAWRVPGGAVPGASALCSSWHSKALMAHTHPCAALCFHPQAPGQTITAT